VDLASEKTAKQCGMMEMPDLPRGHIVEFRYRHRPYPDRPTLSLTMLSSREGTADESVVVFDGVSDLKVTNLNHLSSGESILQARDVRNWQHDGVRYVISDTEDELLTFKCLSWRYPG